MRTHKGVVLDPQLVGAIQPGVDNKDSVEKAIGRPSFVGQFTPNDWYYVSRDVNQVAFRNPRVSKQTVFIVRFDPEGQCRLGPAHRPRTGDERRADPSPDTDARPQAQLLRGAVRQYRERWRAGLGGPGGGNGPQ